MALNDFDMKDESVIDFISLISPNINSVIKDMNWDISKQKAMIAAMWSIINIEELPIQDIIMETVISVGLLCKST